MRESRSHLTDHIPQILATRVAFTDRVRPYLAPHSFWSAIGIPHNWMDRFATLDIWWDDAASQLEIARGQNEREDVVDQVTGCIL